MSELPIATANKVEEDGLLTSAMVEESHHILQEANTYGRWPPDRLFLCGARSGDQYLPGVKYWITGAAP